MQRVCRMPVWSIGRCCRGTPDLTSGLGDPGSSSQMGPQHPLLFLETAGDLDVNVLGREVVFASVDAASNLGNRHAGAVSERLQEKIFPMFIKRERRKRRFLHRPSIVPCEV